MTFRPAKRAAATLTKIFSNASLPRPEVSRWSSTTENRGKNSFSTGRTTDSASLAWSGASWKTFHQAPFAWLSPRRNTMSLTTTENMMSSLKSSPESAQVPFLNLRATYLELKEEMDEAVARVLDSGAFILGKE